jgi:hypothetical protein
MEERHMARTTPKPIEMALGAEIGSYARAELK